jgi:hypothetical protein
MVTVTQPAAGAAPSSHPRVGAPTTSRIQGVGAGFQAGDVTIPPVGGARAREGEGSFEALAANADALGRSGTQRKSVETPHPPATGSGPPTTGVVDPGMPAFSSSIPAFELICIPARIGLLPKRPVSLLRESTTSIPGAGGQPAGSAPAAPAGTNAAGAATSNPARRTTADSDDMYL